MDNTANTTMIKKADCTEEHYTFLQIFFDLHVTLQEFTTRKDLFVVTAETKNSELIGCMLVRQATLSSGKIVYRVQYTAVPTLHRGKGVNNKMLGYLYEYAKENNGANLVASIRNDNVSSIISFLRNGFRIYAAYGRVAYYKTGGMKVRVKRKIV